MNTKLGLETASRGPVKGKGKEKQRIKL